MYHSWNLRKLLRYIAFDMALVLAAILLTRAGRQHFAAVDSAGGVSLPVLMKPSIAFLRKRWNPICNIYRSITTQQYLRKN